MTQVGAVSPRALPGPRAVRRALRTEKAQLARWRRLLRARLDLEIAGFAPPEPLGVAVWDELPGSRDQLPSPAELASAIAPLTPIDPVELMTRLRHLDRALAAYEHDLDAALEESNAQVVRDLAGGLPADVLELRPGAAGR